MKLTLLSSETVCFTLSMTAIGAVPQHAQQPAANSVCAAGSLITCNMCLRAFLPPSKAHLASLSDLRHSACSSEDSSDDSFWDCISSRRSIRCPTCHYVIQKDAKGDVRDGVVVVQEHCNTLWWVHIIILHDMHDPVGRYIILQRCAYQQVYDL